MSSQACSAPRVGGSITQAAWSGGAPPPAFPAPTYARIHAHKRVQPGTCTRMHAGIPHGGPRESGLPLQLRASLWRGRWHPPGTCPSALLLSSGGEQESL